jgi:hypothetical protein
MSHFARVFDDIVVDVIVAEPDVVAQLAGSNEFPGVWVQTSYNTFGGVHYDRETGQPSADQSKALRKNFAGVGYTYDAKRDAFIPPKPQIGTWVLNDNTCLWERVDTDVIP